MPILKAVTITKYFKITTIGSSCNSYITRHPKYNWTTFVYSFIIEVMSTNKSELVKVNGYGDTAANYEAANNVYVVLFASVPFTLQKMWNQTEIN